MRRDLTVGQQAAQLLHAAANSAALWAYRGKHLEMPENAVAVALWAQDQGHLLQLATKLVKAGIDHLVIRECDGEAMAIGILPTTDRAKVRKVVSSLPLMK